MTNDALIEALRRELDGYVRRGLKQRAQAVKEELARLGFSAGATPSEVVQSEPDGTPTTPAKRTRKPVEAPEPAPATKTPPTKKRAR
jgi:hypothetical protein